jgi:glucose-6-phosphate 1-dehydrogenase
MSADDQAEAQKLIQNTMTMGELPEKLSVFGVTRPNMNMEQFIDVLHNAMDGKYSVPIMQEFIDKHAYLWKEVDENLKKEFLSWMTEELQKMKNQPTLAKMIKNMLDTLENE